jgi:hypothetical protein
MEYTGAGNLYKENVMTEAEVKRIPTSQDYEDPEGVEQGEPVDLGEYPIDSVLIRTENRTVYDVVRRMQKEQYILDPDFQRDFVWDSTRQSRLIQSALMRIPLPVFYLAEQPDGRVVVVDGLQRLTTFYRFLNDRFALSGLAESGAELNGKYFRDLPPKFQTRLEDTNLTLYLIDAKVPERARLDIFERVNSGVPLSRQQMRNCLYVGNATRWLKVQSQSEWFKRATTGSLNPDTMRDREAINRFCGFYLMGANTYKGDMDDFLRQTLEIMNGMSDEDLDTMTAAFELSMKNNYHVFDRYAFRKHTSQNEKRSVINIALFDVMSVQMTKYPESYVRSHKGHIQQLFYRLMNDDEFSTIITISTNSLSRVHRRFEIVDQVFQELPDAH